MEKHGEVTYTLTEKEYLKIQRAVDDIYSFMVNDNEYSKEDAHEALKYLNEVFEAGNHYRDDYYDY